MKTYKHRASTVHPALIFGYRERDWEGLLPWKWFHKNHADMIFPFHEIQAAKQSYSRDDPPHNEGIYFLFLGDELQYIGKAVSIYERLISHRFPRPDLDPSEWWDSWAAVWVPEALLYPVEHFYIDVLNPRVNIHRMSGRKELERYRTLLK